MKRSSTIRSLFFRLHRSLALTEARTNRLGRSSTVPSNNWAFDRDANWRLVGASSRRRDRFLRMKIRSIPGRATEWSGFDRSSTRHFCADKPVPILPNANCIPDQYPIVAWDP